VPVCPPTRPLGSFTIYNYCEVFAVLFSIVMPALTDLISCCNFSCGVFHYMGAAPFPFRVVFKHLQAPQTVSKTILEAKRAIWKLSIAQDDKNVTLKPTEVEILTIKQSSRCHSTYVVPLFMSIHGRRYKTFVKNVYKRIYLKIGTIGGHDWWLRYHNTSIIYYI
jgi:hypothetical protein